jgi:hypothetical protein
MHVHEPPTLDALFAQAVAAVDAGDLQELERLLTEHPRLACERLDSPGPWLRDRVGDALDSFFQRPYLLWFVAEDPVRTGRLPANISRIAAAIARVARGSCAALRSSSITLSGSRRGRGLRESAASRSRWST